MDLNSKQLADLICGMRRVYALGENAMAHARDVLKSYGVSGRNHRLATLIAYDLQAGTYIVEIENGTTRMTKKLVVTAF